VDTAKSGCADKLRRIGVGTTGCPALPPPNRAGGSPAHGSPVGGSPLRGLTNQTGDVVREHPKYGERLESFSSITEVVSVRFRRKTQLIRLMAVEFSGGLDQAATCYRCVFRVTNCSSPTFLPPFAPRQLRRFIATMEALTPVRLSPAYRSPCLTYSTFLTIPPPTTLCTPAVALYPLHCSQRDRSPISRPFVFPIDSGHRQNGSRLRHYLAGSPNTPGRIGFVILRTGRSPPVALHPASQRRSYSRLQACSVNLKRTCTSLIGYAHRRRGF
jgi:hypothetical protein